MGSSESRNQATSRVPTEPAQRPRNLTSAQSQSREATSRVPTEPAQRLSLQTNDNLTPGQSQSDSREVTGSVSTEQQPKDNNLTAEQILDDEHENSRVWTEEKCYNPADSSFDLINGDDDMDFECIGFRSLKTRMSCNHTVTPMSLTRWCNRLLDEGNSSFVCGQTDCDVEWPYEEVHKKALLTPKETEYFEKRMFENAAKDYTDIKKCPGCKSYVMRTDLNNLRVRCSLCTADNNKTYEFCWQCLREWKGPSTGSDCCAYDDCINKSLQILATCPEITFKDVRDVTGCPSTRACPTCGLMIEHNRTQCKNIVCSRCKKEFCFVCLKLTVECLKTSCHFSPCSSGVAPRQTSIPVWKKE